LKLWPFNRNAIYVQTVSIRTWLSTEVPDSVLGALDAACKMVDAFHLIRDPKGLSRWIPLPGGGAYSAPLNEGCVAVSECHREGFLGLYIRSGVTEEEPSDGPKMQIRVPRKDAVYTILHECFHLIHFELLREDRSASGGGLKQLGNVLEYIQQTSAYRQAELKAFEANLRYQRLLEETDVDEITLTQAREIDDLYHYLASNEEWLARSYMQVVASRFERSDDRRSVTVYIRGTDVLDIRQYISTHWVRGLDKEFRKLWYELGWGLG
jgi:hypothetical protein